MDTPALDRTARHPMLHAQTPRNPRPVPRIPLSIIYAMRHALCSMPTHPATRNPYSATRAPQPVPRNPQRAKAQTASP